METVKPIEEHQNTEAARLLASGIFVLLIVALSFSLVGIVLAVTGMFVPVAVVPAAVLLATGLVWISWGSFRSTIHGHTFGGVGSVVTVVAIIVVSGLSAGVYSSEHLLTDRDPGVYATTAMWLADEGSLLVDGAVGGFEEIEGITAESPGYYEERDDGLLSPQFMHLLPVWGAAARWMGGDHALFGVNGVVIAGALAAFWLFSALILRPWFAVLATAGLAASLVTVHFARDVYSEPLALLMTFAALAFLVVAQRSQQIGLSVVAGLLIGATAMVRIDAWLVITGFALFLELQWLVVKHRDQADTTRRFIRSVAAGMVMAGAVALVDGFLRSAPYLLENGRRQSFIMMLALLALVLIGGFIAQRAPWSGRIGPLIERSRRTMAWIVPIVVVVAVAGLFVIRPMVQETHAAAPNGIVAGAQDAQGLPLDPTRNYNEWTVHWLSWYMGLGGLIISVAGVALAWRRVLLGRSELLPWLFVGSLTTAVYLLRPSITPDQLWAMRRFLPVVIPFLIVGGALLAEWATDRWDSDTQRLLIAGWAFVILIFVPLSVTAPFRQATSYRGMYDATLAVCEALPTDAALLMTSVYHSNTYQAAVRMLCDMPVARIDESAVDPACAVETARQAWADRGVELYVGGHPDDQLDMTDVETTYVMPEIVITRRPEGMIRLAFRFGLAPAGPSAISSCD